MTKKPIALVQVWFGKLPDYFEYHYDTCLNQNIDFYVFTDQEVDPKFNAPNVKFIPMNAEAIEKRLFDKTGKEIKIKNNYKVCDVRPAYGDIFSEYLVDYEFIGWYDIDTLLGDVLYWVSSYFKDFDAISFGEDGHIYNRLSGPLTIIRNVPNLTNAYLNDPVFYETMKIEKYAEYDEQKFTELLSNLGIKTKIIFNCSNLDPADWKVLFDAVWSGGKLYINGEEKLIYHFYRKTLTKFERKGNTIVAGRKFEYEDDFLWVTYFTESYEPIVKTMIQSLSKFSKRKCVLYTVNYTSKFEHMLSDQFIVRRIDMGTGGDSVDIRNRSFIALLSKPVITLDSIKSFLGKKFVYIDTDIYVTANADGIAKYFKSLDDYPLVNSHVHDVIYCHDNGELVSSLHALGDALGVEVSIFPRRKCNVMLYDDRSEWLFKEQMDIYYKHKDSMRRCIFKFHDEDTMNIILSKNKLLKSLPVVDIEEGYTIDLDRISNYSYNFTAISQLARIPKTDRDVYVFHGYKNSHDWEQINLLYSQTVLDQEDLLVKYDGKNIILIKNSFIRNKKFEPTIVVKIFNQDGTVIFEWPWQIFTTQFFYVWNVNLIKGQRYLIELEESSTKRLVFRQELLTK